MSEKDLSEITDSAFLSSTLANASASGLTLDEVVEVAWQVQLYEEEYGKAIEENGEYLDVFHMFDEAISAKIDLDEIVGNQPRYKRITVSRK
jgi:hypothetical protein